MRFFIVSFFIFNSLIVNAQQEPVDLYISSAFGVKGDEVMLHVRANNFEDIQSFQASLNWDPALLAYKGVSNFGISYFDEVDFGTTASAQGHIRFIWEPLDGNPITEVDSTILFSVTFEIISDQAQDVPIGYVDQVSSPPFPIEFANSDYEVLTVNSYDGIVIIVSSLEDLVNIENNPNTSCDEKMGNGSLSADVDGEIAGYKFHWFAGSEVKATPDHIGNRYENLFSGEYALQVLTGNDEVFVEKIVSTVLDVPAGTPDIISVISNTPQTSCSFEQEKLTGSIEIEVNSEQPADAYNINWWSGSFDGGTELIAHKDQFKAVNLDAGNYEIVVKNRSTGCVAYHQETVNETLVQFLINLSSNDNNFCVGNPNGALMADVADTDVLDLRYYWFEANMPIDTTAALHRGKNYAGVAKGNYTSFVVDLISECASETAISVEDNLIIPTSTISQRNDTLFANDEQASWFRNDVDLEVTAPYLVPDESGYYQIEVTNEYNCSSSSESLYFGITGLKDERSDISIYPIPFTDEFHISNHQSDIDFIQILDANGKTIKELHAVENGLIDINLADSPQGFYFIRIGENGVIHSRKIIKILP